MRRDDAATAGLWPRAAALLCRQGIESALEQLYERTAPGLQRTSGRCRMLCAGPMLNDSQLGGRVILAWNELSEACHHRVYELAPTAADLAPALDTVWELADAVERLRAAMR